MTSSRLLKTILMIAIVLGVVAAWVGFGERGFLHVYRMDLERRNTLERIRDLAGQNQDLMEQIERLRTDTNYVESVARTELGLVKPNEIIYRFKKEEGHDHKPDSGTRRAAQALKY